MAFRLRYVTAGLAILSLVAVPLRPASAQAAFSASLIPSDAEVYDQWYLDRIKAFEAWDTVRESPNVVVAVIDSGVDTDHPDLAGNIWVNRDEIPGNGIDDDRNGYIDDVNGWDFVNNVPDPNPKFTPNEYSEIGINHGTIVAGVIAARGDNDFGIAGITWRAQIMALKAINDRTEGTPSDVIRALDYATNNGADIINLSFTSNAIAASTVTPEIKANRASLREAIERAQRAGVIVVAAAGNDDIDLEPSLSDDGGSAHLVCYDSQYLPVVGVAATDNLDEKALFSNYGFSCIDIAAPGLGFLGLTVYEPGKEIGRTRFDEYVRGYWAGTSMAAPVVTGALALLKGLDPQLKPAEAIAALTETADPINRLNPDFVGQLGSGRLNLAAAVARVRAEMTKTRGVVASVPASEAPARVRLNDTKAREFLAYAETFTGGANVAAGDLNGDGVDEIIVGSGSGGGPHIRIFDSNGELQGQFFAYAEHFRGGVQVAAGDLNGDGKEEIIAGAGFTGGPHIRIFDAHGRLQGQFFAYAEHFRGGVNVAAGDLDGDGTDEIIAGAGFTGGPHVRVFSGAGKLQGQFFAYAEHFRGGVQVAAGDVTGDGRAEIIAGAGRTGGPHVRVFDGAGKVTRQFFAYDPNFRGGVNVGVGDLDQDGISEIVTGAGVGGGPHVRVFNGQGQLQRGFFVYEETFRGGVNVGVVQLPAGN